MENTLTLDLRPENPQPLHQQVYEQIRRAILSGRMRSRQKLPASRQLAKSLGISRTTVTQSYDQLISEGYLETRRGSGTFVCAQIPDALLYTAPEAIATNAPTSEIAAQTSTKQTPAKQTQQFPQPEASRQPANPQPSKLHQFDATADPTTADQSTAHPITLSTYGQRLLKTINHPTSTPETYSFRYWRPDFDLFPKKQWQRCVNRHCGKSHDWMTYSLTPMGYEPLRSEIATYIAQTRAVHCTPEQILITQGTQQALGLLAQVLLNEGDAIALEDPGYLSARKVLSAHGALTFPIPVDEQGLNVAQLVDLSTQTTPIKLVYVTPSHQFPTGALMSLPRRLALLKWAQQTGGLIIEDDYDSAFRYSGRPIPALQGLDSHQRVLYIGTFSKIMFPGLRLGYLVLPDMLVPAFERAKWVCDRQSNLLNQAALADFIAQGHLAKHVRKTRTVYAQRRAKLIEQLTDISAPFGHLKILGDPAGLHFMARLPIPPHIGSGQALQSAAKEQGIGLFHIDAYQHPQSSTSLDAINHSRKPAANSTANSTENSAATAATADFIFGFGGLNETAIEAAIDQLRPLFSTKRPLD